MTEHWRKIIGFWEYEISSLGRVRRGDKVLKLSDKGNGYRQVNLYKNGKCYGKLVHRLVAQAFIPNWYGKPQVHHIDYNKTNNSVDNLKWVNQSEQYDEEWKERHKTNVYGSNKRKIMLDGIIYESEHEASRKTGIPRVTINKAVNRGQAHVRGMELIICEQSV